MKYVLADIKNGKICGLYGGRSEKYHDVWEYTASSDIHNLGYKFDDIKKAIKVKKRKTNK